LLYAINISDQMFVGHIWKSSSSVGGLSRIFCLSEDSYHEFKIFNQI